MELTTLGVAITITVLVFFATKASKLNTLIQTVLSLISFTVSVIIYSQWSHNPLVATVMFVMIALMVNLGLILSISKWLPTIEVSFQIKPIKSYLLLALVIILLFIYILFLAFVGLLANSVSYPIAIMVITGGFTIMIGILVLLYHLYFQKT